MTPPWVFLKESPQQKQPQQQQDKQQYGISSLIPVYNMTQNTATNMEIYKGKGKGHPWALVRC